MGVVHLEVKAADNRFRRVACRSRNWKSASMFRGEVTCKNCLAASRPTMQELLRAAVDNGAEVRLVARENSTDGLHFCAHLMGVDGPTVDFRVDGNKLLPVPSHKHN